MKPNLRPAYQRVGIAAGVSVVLSAILVWTIWDGGVLADSYEQEKIRYEQTKGSYRLSDLVREYDEAIVNSQDQISDLKNIMDMSEVAPFIKPERDSGGYIAYLLRFLHQELQLKAQTFPLQARLGFNDLSTSLPSEEEAQGWLTMLQLVTKALFLCAEAPGAIDEVTITKLTTTPIPTGPAGRPPLLYEYPFSIEITASLESISWLLQQFSSDARSPGNKDEDLIEWLGMIQRGVVQAGLAVTKPEDTQAIGPLIVRGFNIEGSRIEEDRISRLKVTIDLAGMSFIPDSERGDSSGSRGAHRSHRTSTGQTGGTTKPKARN